MVLILTNSGDATADYLCDRLRQQHIQFVRLDTDHLSKHVKFELAELETSIVFDGLQLYPDQISNVWLRRPRPIVTEVGDDKEECWHTSCEWAEAMEGFLNLIPIAKWINHPTRNAIASHKTEQLVRASRMGISVPDSIVTQCPETLRKFWHKHEGNVITKPLASGYIARSSINRDTSIYTSKVDAAHLQLAELVRSCPTLCQQRIIKETDVRVTVLDEQMHAVAMARPMRDGTQIVDIRRDNMRDVSFHSIAVPDPIRDAILRLIRSYELRFAAIDFAIDKDRRWHFFEINPNGQWAWLDLAKATDIAASFIKTFKT